MSHLLNGFPNLLWCDCSTFWWCSEFNISHHYDYLCQSLTKVFVWCIRLPHHRSKLNRLFLMVIITISQYHSFTKDIFSSTEICGNILNIFWGGIKPSNLLYKINWDTWSYIVFLDIVVCGRLCIVLAISDIGFT